MKPRVLKSRTIVPDQLYVEREADRQLRDILDDMGRPGYVLVARQMGKTNLLLHMKRQRKNDLVLYLDLSNRFLTPKQWFRNIIDALLEAFPEILPISTVEIARLRAAVELEGNVEYDRHLRLILREINRKLIIVLDEIDSLINTSYSDMIFAQIRSMYFSRANYPEYENLTYVLSGVIEPTELIKDKNISPFNIGEKIYLENFTRDEVAEFIQRAEITLNNVVIDRLYDWAGGNPRMTWDICSELELTNSLARERPETIDEIVLRIYLDQFDRPPVDHIRALATADRKIRDAIVSIRYGKSDYLDQNLKNKLYLAGITSSAGGTAALANKIIDRALSEEWMRGLSSGGSVGPILLVVQQRDFRSAVKLLNELRASPNDSFSTEEERLLAESHLNLGNYTDALKEYESCLADRPSPEIKQLAHLGIGQALAELGNSTEASAQLTLALEGPSQELAQKSMLYRALEIRDDDEDRLKEALSQCEELLNVPRLDVFIRVLSRYVRHTLYRRIRQFDLAKNELELALQDAIGDIKASLKLALASFTDERKTRVRLLRELVAELESAFAKYLLAGDVDLAFGQRRLFELFSALLKNNLLREAIRLADAYGEQSFANPVSGFSAIKHLYSEVDNLEFSGKIRTEILLFAVKHLRPQIQPRVEYIEVLREIISFKDQSDSQQYRRIYVNELIQSKESELFFDEKHSAALSSIAMSCVRDGDWRFAKDIFEAWEIYRDQVEPKNLGRLLLDFMHMRALATGMSISTVSTRDAALRVLAFYDDVEQSSDEPSSREATLAFQKEAAELIKSVDNATAEKTDPFRSFGRNDRIVVQYGVALPIEKKFKQVEADLRSGQCNFLRIVQRSKA